MKFTIINEYKRSVLSEGRSRGIGHALLKREGSVLTAVMPESPCKDYLSDAVYSEQSGKPYSACGLNTKKHGAFDTHAYLSLSVCKSGAYSPSVYDGWQKEVDKLAKDYKVMELFLQKFEELFKFKDRTEIHPVSENLFAMVVPLEWVSATYLISLYSLLLRNGLYWDGKEDVLAFLSNSDACPEYMKCKQILPKIKIIIAGKHHPQDFTKKWDVHSYGIVYWDLSKKHE